MYVICEQFELIHYTALFCSGLDITRTCPKGESENATLFYDGSNYKCFFVTGPKNTHASMKHACVELYSTMAVIDTADKMLHLQNNSIPKEKLAYIHAHYNSKLVKIRMTYSAICRVIKSNETALCMPLT